MRRATVLAAAACVLVTLSGAANACDDTKRPYPPPRPVTPPGGQFGQSPGDTAQGQPCSREGQERNDNQSRTLVCTRRGNQLVWWPR